MKTREIVPENALEAVSESLKTKISWGSMPPDPLVYAYAHVHSFHPPLDEFINEGLLTLCFSESGIKFNPNTTMHASSEMYT